MNRRTALALIAAWLLSAGVTMPAPAAQVEFPPASLIGLAPPKGLSASKSFPGFEDRANNVFIRLVALPGQAFAEIEKTMTNEALRKQGLAVEKRETLALGGGKGLLVVAQQKADSVRIRKWLLIAPLGAITALVSFEIPSEAAALYPDAAIRTALASLAARSVVPVKEQLALLPFKLSDLAGFRLVRVVPGMGLQLTDGPKDTLDAYDQPHLVISIATGGPQRPDERGHFARLVFSGLPPLKDVHMLSSESMRIGSQPGHEIRAKGKDATTGDEVEIVQWLRFGTGAYIRILGLAPKQNWTPSFMRFRTVRDSLEPR
jgi:hypothetical protein